MVSFGSFIGFDGSLANFLEQIVTQSFDKSILSFWTIGEVSRLFEIHLCLSKLRLEKTVCEDQHLGEARVHHPELG